MFVLRCFVYLILLMALGCKQKVSTGDLPVAANTKINRLSITREDFGLKSICLDSSGFYYLLLDSENIKSAVYKPKRIDLSNYTTELKLFKSFDTGYFALLDKSVGVSCGVSKEPFTVVIEQDGRGYNYHPGVCASYNSTSSFYKMQLVRDFFIQLKKDYPSNL